MPVKFVSITFLKSSVGSETMSASNGEYMPMQFTRISTFPNFFIVSSTQDLTSVSFRTSVFTKTPLLACDRVSRAPSSSISTTTIFAPSRANRTAIARPIPEEAPVIMEILSLNCIETSPCPFIVPPKAALRRANARIPLPLPLSSLRLPATSAKLRQQFRSKWVRAKFRIRDQMKQVKFSEEVASRLRRSARPLCAKRKAANRHGSEKSIWTFRLRRRRFWCAKRTTNEICFQFLTNKTT